MFGDVPKTPEDLFQLTPSRRATHSPIPHQIHKYISTHALTEGDSRKSSSIAYGNISTHALTEGDQYGYHACWEIHISTHALTEGDRKDMFCSSVCMNFNSRPHGGRPVAHEVIAGQWGFQLTPSRRATRLLATIPTPGTFQLTPSRRATSREKQYMDSILFQLTPSRRATS